MYEIVFKCRACSAHLSASADDAGYEFDCPACGAAIAVPAGDILFGCPQCQTQLLASKDAVGDNFECPQCQLRVQVPTQGKEIQIPERPQILVDAQGDGSERPIPAAHSAPESEVYNEDTTQVERQFMTTWGDYLAAAGLTEVETKKEEPKKHEGEQGGRGYGSPGAGSPSGEA